MADLQLHRHAKQLKWPANYFPLGIYITDSLTQYNYNSIVLAP